MRNVVALVVTTPKLVAPRVGIPKYTKEAPGVVFEVGVVLSVNVAVGTLTKRPDVLLGAPE